MRSPPTPLGWRLWEILLNMVMAIDSFQNIVESEVEDIGDAEFVSEIRLSKGS